MANAKVVVSNSNIRHIKKCPRIFNIFSIYFLFFTISGVFLITGCATTIDPAGNISSETKTVPDIMSQIKIGVTTKEDLIQMFGEPSSQMVDAMGNERLVLGEKVPFWETGAGAFFTGKQKVRVLIVTLQNGVVTNFQKQEKWTKRK